MWLSTTQITAYNSQVFFVWVSLIGENFYFTLKSLKNLNKLIQAISPKTHKHGALLQTNFMYQLQNVQTIYWSGLLYFNEPYLWILFHSVFMALAPYSLSWWLLGAVKVLLFHSITFSQHADNSWIWISSWMPAAPLAKATG